MYAIFSVSMVIFILGLFGLVILHTQQLIVYFKENVSINIELKNNVPQEQVQKVRQKLEALPYVKPASVVFTPKEQALSELEKDFGKNFIDLGMPNPLFDVLEFNVKSNFMNADTLQIIKNLMAKLPQVNDVYYQEGLLKELEENIQKVALVGIITSVLFILVALSLIHNTIKLAMYSNRFLIKNMELVGASWEFITRPYITRSILHGALSALFAIAALIGILILIQRDIPEIQTLENKTSLFLLFLGLLGLGILLTAASTYYTVNKYLKMRLDDLY